MFCCCLEFHFGGWAHHSFRWAELSITKDSHSYFMYHISTKMHHLGQFLHSHLGSLGDERRCGGIIFDVAPHLSSTLISWRRKVRFHRVPSKNCLNLIILTWIELDDFPTLKSARFPFPASVSLPLLVGCCGLSSRRKKRHVRLHIVLEIKVVARRVCHKDTGHDVNEYGKTIIE